MTDQKENTRNRKAALVTFLFHAAVILGSLYFGLKQPNPLPEEAGASIEFGWDQEASGDIAADIQSEQPAQTQTQATESTAPAEPTPDQPEEEVATDDESDISVPKEKDEKPKTKPKEEPVKKPEAEEKPKPELDDKLKGALESLKNPSSGSGGSKGSSETGTGQQGDPAGGKSGGGALGGGSGSWSLDGRSMMQGYGTKISTTKEEGTVVLNIWVNRKGEVTKVQPNLAESNTTSTYLINLATNDVLNNFKFNEDGKASFEQRGTVRYHFKLK